MPANPPSSRSSRPQAATASRSVARCSAGSSPESAGTASRGTSCPRLRSWAWTDFDHRAQAVRAVGGHQCDRVGILAGDEVLQRRLEGEHPQAGRDSLVEHGEAGVEAGRQRVGREQARAEAVDRRDVGRLGVARRGALAERQEARADPLAELPGGALGEGDREDLRRAEPVLEHRGDEALDEHRRLAAACGGRQRERPRARGCLTLGVLLGGQPHRQIAG